MVETRRLVRFSTIRRSRCQAETHADPVGHAQAVGDAFEQVDGGDGAAAVHVEGDGALGQAGGGADAGLAGSGMLADQP